MRRAVESPSNPSTMVKELQGLLAVLPASEGGSGELEVRDSIDTPTRLVFDQHTCVCEGFAAITSAGWLDVEPLYCSAHCAC